MENKDSKIVQPSEASGLEARSSHPPLMAPWSDLLLSQGPPGREGVRTQQPWWGHLRRRFLDLRPFAEFSRFSLPCPVLLVLPASLTGRDVRPHGLQQEESVVLAETRWGRAELSVLASVTRTTRGVTPSRPGMTSFLELVQENLTFCRRVHASSWFLSPLPVTLLVTARLPFSLSSVLQGARVSAPSAPGAPPARI